MTSPMESRLDVAPPQQPNQPPQPPPALPFDEACAIYRKARLMAIAAHQRYSVEGTQEAYDTYSAKAEVANRAMAAVDRSIRAEVK
jgi:hypothetical protein